MASARRQRPVSRVDGDSTGQHHQSRRYKKLKAALNKALDMSFESIDTRAAVAECYGADASIFAGSGAEAADGSGDKEEATDILANLIEGVMERANEKLRSEWDSILESEGIGTMLAAFDRLVEEDERRQREDAAAEEEDRRSAREAANSSRLPKGVTPEAFLMYHARRVKSEERDRLLAEIADVEEQNKAVQSLIEKGKDLVKGRVAEIESRGREMDIAADSCLLSGAR